MSNFIILPPLAVLPEGAVRDETSFLILISALAILISVAIFLRLRRKS